MSVELRLHDLGEGMQEGEIVRWLVHEGEHVQEDQPVVEVQTDKVVAEIAAPASGVVDKIFAATGEVVPVNALILSIRKEEEDSVYPPKQKERLSGQRALAAPATRRLARKLAVDIERIKGSGPGGRVLERDVRQASESDNERRHAHQPFDTVEESEVVRPEGASHPMYREETVPAPEKLSFTGLRGTVAKNMVQSAFTIPHVTHFDEIDVTELIRIRRHVKSKEVARGIKLTFLPFFIKTIVVALQEFPIFNARWSENGQDVSLHKSYNIGVAVDTADGLIVPVVRHAERKSILQMAKEIEWLAEKARNRRLNRDELSGGTFTVSNIGSVGGLFATPIIRYPEVALMAFHKIKARPVAVEEDGERRVAIRDLMNISLSFDHRVADGAAVVRFTNRIMALLESPEELLLELV